MFLVEHPATRAAAFVTVLLALATDFLDGYYARKRGLVSDAGKLLDPFADFIFYAAVFGSFCYADWMPAWMFIAVMAREVFMHAFLRPFFRRRGIILQAKMSGKVKTVCQGVVSLLVVLFAIIVDAGGDPALFTELAWWMLLLVVILSVGSLAHYLLGLRELRRN